MFLRYMYTADRNSTNDLSEFLFVALLPVRVATATLPFAVLQTEKFI